MFRYGKHRTTVLPSWCQAVQFIIGYMPDGDTVLTCSCLELGNPSPLVSGRYQKLSSFRRIGQVLFYRMKPGNCLHRLNL